MDLGASRRWTVFAGILAAAVVLFPSIGAAQYPERPIRLIHGFGPGGPADSMSRILADAMSADLKQPIIVEAKPGAGGNIGADAVAKAEPDGYTIGLVTGGHAVSGALYRQLPFDPVESFQMISTVVDYSFLIVVRPDSEAKTLGQLIALAKAKPGELNYGSAGVGSTQHLTAELLLSNAGIKMVHVPYRGDAPAILGLLGQQVTMIVAAASSVLPQVQAGTVKALAVSTDDRWSGLPDVPTVAESGVPQFDVRTWAGLLAPKGTPAPQIERLHRALSTALRDPEVKTKLETVVAGTVRARSPDDMKRMVASEVARWAKVIAEAGIPRQ